MSASQVRSKSKFLQCLSLSSIAWVIGASMCKAIARLSGNKSRPFRPAALEAERGVWLGRVSATSGMTLVCFFFESVRARRRRIPYAACHESFTRPDSRTSCRIGTGWDSWHFGECCAFRATQENLWVRRTGKQRCDSPAYTHYAWHL